MSEIKQFSSPTFSICRATLNCFFSKNIQIFVSNRYLGALLISQRFFGFCLACVPRVSVLSLLPHSVHRCTMHRLFCPAKSFFGLLRRKCCLVCQQKSWTKPIILSSAVWLHYLSVSGFSGIFHQDSVQLLPYWFSFYECLYKSSINSLNSKWLMIKLKPFAI